MIRLCGECSFAGIKPTYKRIMLTMLTDLLCLNYYRCKETLTAMLISATGQNYW